MDMNLIKIITENGMGVIAFAILMYAGIKLIRFMDVFLSNHMTHVQSSLENIESHMAEVKDALNKLANKD